ncbi:MAG TPA: ATP-binding protein [Ilumatobacter sp.]|nr:ATP-binding protein [Ilumatobacter sp.]
MERFPTLTSRPALFPTGLTMLQAIVVARWLSLAWMVGIVVFDHEDLRHPAVAWAAVATALAVAATSTWLLRAVPERLLSIGFVLAEVGLAVGLSIVDGYVFEPGHVFNTTQSIATQWPLIAAATAGVAYGPWVAALLAATVGPAELIGAVLNDYASFGTREVVSIVATSLFFGACGAVFGWMAHLLKRAERHIAERNARDEVGRVMHDTVLQTLALVERRTAGRDPELAAAAREADRDLRAYLFGSTGRDPVDLPTRVRAAVEHARRRYGDQSEIAVSVSVIADDCRVPDQNQELIARAIGEAVANALEHARPSRIVVFAETDDEGQIFASVRDNGTGFDTSIVRVGHGIDQSIMARIESIGGMVTLTSSAENGTEVCMWSTTGARGSSA